MHFTWHQEDRDVPTNLDTLQLDKELPCEPTNIRITQRHIGYCDDTKSSISLHGSH